jgi:hypothetical protein
MAVSSSKQIKARLRQSSRENCVNWRGSPLRSGDNVLFLSLPDDNIIPGQIIDIQDYRDIPEDELDSVTLAPKDLRSRMVLIRHRKFASSKERRPLDQKLFCHVPDGMQEVIESVVIEWVQWKSIVSPCFIFHVDAVQRGSFTCKGMSRCFFSSGFSKAGTANFFLFRRTIGIHFTETNCIQMWRVFRRLCGTTY